MGLGLVDGFREAIRVLLGLPADPGQPPDLMRLGLYRARVDVCQSDGQHCDVTPDDKRLSAEKNVPVRVGIPGAQAAVAPGAVVLLGWERGDPARPFCVPSWESGATVLQLILNAVALYLGAQAGALPAARQTDPVDLGTFAFQQASGSGVTNGGVLTWTPPGGGSAVNLNGGGADVTGKIKTGSTVVSIA